MEKKIKLRPKQLAAINEIQQQKQQLTKMFQELSEKEGLLISFVFESADEVVEKATEIKLEGEFIVFKEVEAKVVEPAKVVTPKKKKVKDESIA